MGTFSHMQRNFVLLCLLAQVFLWPLILQTTAQFNRKAAKNSVSYNLRFNKMRCAHTPYKYTQLHYCFMEQLSNGSVGLNISITIPVEINYLGIQTKLFYKYTTYRPFMIDWSMEYCQAARNGHYSPTTGLMMKIMEETLPDFYYPCPHGNRTYITFWMFEPKYIMQSIPSGDYRMDVFFRDSADENLVAMQLFGTVRKQGLLG
uniref:Uncharacterized protein n=1 Tax=Anopheles christyi TaxID=43041 RepID=A0A240PLN4_9DIPT